MFESKNMLYLLKAIEKLPTHLLHLSIDAYKKGNLSLGQFCEAVEVSKESGMKILSLMEVDVIDYDFPSFQLSRVTAVKLSFLEVTLQCRKYLNSGTKVPLPKIKSALVT